MVKVKQNKNEIIATQLNQIDTIAWYKNPFFITIFFISIFRLWITSDVRLIGVPSTTDDFHYVITAYYNKMGKWLGPLDQYTLHTLPFFAIFLATLSKFKISLIFANHFLYVLSWVFGIFTLRHFIKKDWVLIFAFLLVLFNPMFYAGDVSRVVREGMWVPCATFIFFCYIRMFFVETQFIVKTIYSIVIGLLVSAFYLTREDGIMIYPLMLFLITSFLWIQRKNIKSEWIKTSILIVLPFIILKLCCWNIIRLNKTYYKADFLYENQMKEGADFMSLLNSIKQNKKVERITLTTENRLKLYELSPTFAQLKPYDQIFQSWSEQSGAIKGECIHFGTALKSVFLYAGYYQNYTTIRLFYINATLELKKLIENGTFQLIEPHPLQKYVPVINLRTFSLSDIISKTLECLWVVVTLDDFKLLDSHEFGEYTYGNEQTIAILKEVTNSKLAYTEQEATPKVKEAYKNTLKNILLNFNYTFYKLITIILLTVALFSFLYLLLNKKFLNDNPILVVIILFSVIVILIRVIMLTLVCSSSNICLFSVKYLTIVYPFMYFFSGISVGLMLEHSKLYKKLS